MSKYDCESETRKHIHEVGKNINGVIQRLLFRIMEHDESKMSQEEKYLFDKYTPKLAKCTYGSKEYKKYLKELEPALTNHYGKNRHHPEFHMRTDDYILNKSSAIGCMNLIDIIEMLCDWKAATMRHNDGEMVIS